MVSGKTAKKRRGSSPLVSSRRGLPWLTIAAVVVIVALAAGIFAVVYSQSRKNDEAAAAAAQWTPSADNKDPSTKIPGIYVGQAETDEQGNFSYTDYKAALHVSADQRVAYDRFPAVGGPHDGEWAACDGVVYSVPVREENLVHTLEHGAVWIAYNPDTIAPGDLDVLTGLVDGQPYMSLSPYPGLDAPISLQAWGHQLKVDSATDERVQDFITALRLNSYVYPEIGATCSQPTFDTQNPPPFDASPRGADAVPMDGAGASEASTEMIAPADTSGADASVTDSPTAPPAGETAAESTDAPPAESSAAQSPAVASPAAESPAAESPTSGS